MSMNVERRLQSKSHLEEVHCRFDSVHAGEKEVISEELFTELEANFASSCTHGILTLPADYLSRLMYCQW